MNTDTPFFDAEAFVKNDWNLHFQFERLVTPTDKMTEKGIPVFNERDFVMVYIPRDAGSPEIIPAEVNEFCKRHRNAAVKVMPAYKAWKESQEQPLNGFPLKQVQGIPKSIVLQFEFLKIYTAEQLIASSDTAVDKIPDGRKYQQLVKRMLEASERNAAANKLAKENEDLKARLSIQEAELKKLATKMETLKGEEKK